MSERLDLVLDPIGWKLLSSFEPMSNDDAIALGQRMRRKGIDPAQVAAVTTQLALRYEGREKFGQFADQLIYTRKGMEQASRLTVAALHADRFRQAGAQHVADLGCGIGIDSLAIAGLGLAVSAVDIDDTTLAAARVNLRFFDNASTYLADATQVDLIQLGAASAPPIDAVFADPARRDERGRLHDPEDWSPPLSTVIAYRNRPEVKSVGIKVSPAIRYDDLPSDAHVVFTSVDGELVEACIWLGDAAYDGPGRSATALHSTGKSLSFYASGVDNPQQPPVEVSAADKPGAYLFEPDPAFIRAGLIADICADTASQPIGDKIAYLTADHLPGDPWAEFMACFEILDECPLKPAAIKKMAGHADFLEIKKRGVDIHPSVLRRQIFGGKKSGKKGGKKKGKKAKNAAVSRTAPAKAFDAEYAGASEPLTLVCTRTPAGRRAFLCRRIDPTH